MPKKKKGNKTSKRPPKVSHVLPNLVKQNAIHHKKPKTQGVYNNHNPANFIIPLSNLTSEAASAQNQLLQSSSLAQNSQATDPQTTPPLIIKPPPGIPRSMLLDFYLNHIRPTNENIEESPSTSAAQPGEKRVSAFDRLGPQASPKLPKMTINLNLSTDQPTRSVVEDKNDDKYIPVHLRPNVLNSTDEMVMKYLVFWPWKKEIRIRKTACARSFKSVMLLEQERMEELYDKEKLFIQVEVKGYPSSWRKEDVLDAVFECVKGNTLIPCFIEFTKTHCKFLVLRSKPALMEIHRCGFRVFKGDVELQLAISESSLTLNVMDFVPRVELRKRLMMGFGSDSKLSLKAFTLQDDVSNFMYFPLNRGTNQFEITQLKTSIIWKYLTQLDLSYNRLRFITDFNLQSVTPSLKQLDLSYNYLQRVTDIIDCRRLPLTSLSLEGNPLCTDYRDPAYYVKVIRAMFPSVTEIDGQPVHKPGKLPQFFQNFCLPDADSVVEKFLEVYFPLLESTDQRHDIENLYDSNVTMTITCNNKLRHAQMFNSFRNLFMWCSLQTPKSGLDCLDGVGAVAKLLGKWPAFEHDPTTFTVDVLHHDNNATVFRVDGVLKLTSQTLAENEYLLAFSRTFVLFTNDGSAYKIRHEMIHWDEPTEEYVKKAFQLASIKSPQISLKFDLPPDEDLKAKLLQIFMKVTESDTKHSERCLEETNWHLKDALEHFMKLVKTDCLL